MHREVTSTTTLSSSVGTVIMKEMRIIYITESHDSGVNTRNWDVPNMSQC